MITVKEALNRLDTKQSYTIADRLSAMARICTAIRDEGYILLDTKGFDLNSKDECYEAVQRAKEGQTD